MAVVVLILTDIVLIYVIPSSSHRRQNMCLKHSFLFFSYVISGFVFSDGFLRNFFGLGIGVFLDLIGIPILSVVATSAFSKVTRPETQGSYPWNFFQKQVYFTANPGLGFSQGLRRSVSFLAMILGPIWAGSLVNQMYIMLGVCLVINALALVSSCNSYFFSFYITSTIIKFDFFFRFCL